MCGSCVEMCQWGNVSKAPAGCNSLDSPPRHLVYDGIKSRKWAVRCRKVTGLKGLCSCSTVTDQCFLKNIIEYNFLVCC